MKTQDTYKSEHLERWTMPHSYFGEMWPDYYVFLHRNRDSDCMTNSNFEVALERLSKLPEYKDEHSRTAIRESHWAVGWVECIAIHADDVEALKAADEMAEKMDGYPVLDEENFSAREEKEAQQIWASCYSWRERVKYIREHESQFEPHDWQDLLGCVRGRYFIGYAGELVSR